MTPEGGIFMYIMKLKHKFAFVLNFHVHSASLRTHGLSLSSQHEGRFCLLLAYVHNGNYSTIEHFAKSTYAQRWGNS